MEEFIGAVFYVIGLEIYQRDVLQSTDEMCFLKKQTKSSNST